LILFYESVVQESYKILVQIYSKKLWSGIGNWQNTGWLFIRFQRASRLYPEVCQTHLRPKEVYTCLNSWSFCLFLCKWAP